jgi:hypothetical protein
MAKDKRQRVVITLRDNDDRTDYTAEVVFEPGADKQTLNSPALNAGLWIAETIKQNHAILSEPMDQMRIIPASRNVRK